MLNSTDSRPADDLSLEPSTESSEPNRLRAFPVGSRVLHIGAPKTGTTAIQAAQGQLRAGLAEGLISHPISIPGTPLEQARAALAVMNSGTGWASDYQAAPLKYWDRLVRRTREAPGTVFISSEYLCEADGPTIRRIADELADGDVRAVLTLRPLARILPSAWQQYLKSGHALPYERWLKAVLSDPPKASVTPTFWPRHDQAAVVDRWASEIGADRLTVVILDPADRGLLLRSFEDLLALPTETLASMPPGQQNRSMTAAEAEVFRQVNVALRAKKLPYEDYSHLVRYGAIMRVVERLIPGPEAVAVTTPGWALERAIELGTEYGERIDALRSEGLTVIGDPRQLADAPAPVEVAPAPEMIEVSIAVEALIGVVARAVNGKAFFPDEAESDPTTAMRGMPGAGRSMVKPVPASELTFRQLTEVMGRHVDRAVRRRARKARLALKGKLPL